MPLVYRVCRTASALMLSHGGSRLNASKPEANPKTRCPKSTLCEVKFTDQFLNMFHTTRAFRRGQLTPKGLEPFKRIRTVQRSRMSRRQTRGRWNTFWPPVKPAPGGEQQPSKHLTMILLRSNRLSNHCRLRGLGGAKYHT